MSGRIKGYVNGVIDGEFIGVIDGEMGAVVRARDNVERIDPESQKYSGEILQIEAAEQENDGNDTEEKSGEVAENEE